MLGSQTTNTSIYIGAYVVLVYHMVKRLCSYTYLCTSSVAITLYVSYLLYGYSAVIASLVYTTKFENWRV